MSDPYEIRATNYPHPERTHGQHTNGPANLFIRRAGGPWYRVSSTRLPRVVRGWINTLGLDVVLATFCHLIEEPTP